MFEELKTLKTDSKTLRKFAFLVGSILLVIAFLARRHGHATRMQVELALAILLLVPGIFYPKALKAIYVAWMMLAFVMGFFVSRLLLSLLYFLVVTPLGLIMRLSGKMFLDVKYPESKDSFWIVRREVKSKESYLKQY